MRYLFSLALTLVFVFSLSGCPGKAPSSPASPTATPTPVPSWKPLGSAGFYPNSATSMSLFVYNNTPYIAFQDGSTSGPVVMDFNGSSWVTVGTANFLGTTTWAGYDVLYVYNGTPYLAFSDGTKSYKASVMSFTSNTWSYVGSGGFSAGQFDCLSMYLDSSGQPYVAYSDYTTTPADETTVMTYASSSWSAVGGSAGITPGFAAPTELFPYSGQPAVAYGDGTNSTEPSAMAYSGSAWGQMGSAGFSTNLVATYGNAWLAGGTPYVGFAQNGGGFFIYSYGGSSWSLFGSDFTNGGNTSTYASFAASGTTPYVAFQDGANGKKATVVTYNGSNWVDVGQAGFGSGPVSYTCMGFYNNDPIVAFADGGNSGKPTVMIYK